MKKIVSKCPLCSYEGDMKVSSVVEGRNIIKCKNCSLEFMFPIPTDKEIEEIYSKNYFDAWGLDNGETKEVGDMKRKTFVDILNGILPYVKSGNILDVGTATGFLLEEAKKIGFNPYGVEISEYASSIAKNKFGEDRIYNGPLENANFSAKNFDLITMCDVIEHVKDPVETMKTVNRLLKDDAYVLITTPNTKSLTAKILGKRWHRYMLEHLNYFDNISMQKMCEVTGFKLVKYYPCKKVININFLYSIARVYKQFLISQAVTILHCIPLINRMDFPILMGELTYILKKEREI